MHVKVGKVYVFDPSPWDVINPQTSLKKGDRVRVVNDHRCPPVNTMGNCHVEGPDGRFAGLVRCDSLTPV